MISSLDGLTYSLSCILLPLYFSAHPCLISPVPLLPVRRASSSSYPARIYLHPNPGLCYQSSVETHLSEGDCQCKTYGTLFGMPATGTSLSVISTSLNLWSLKPSPTLRGSCSCRSSWESRRANAPSSESDSQRLS